MKKRLTLLVIQSEINLYEVFSNEMGRQFFSLLRSLPVFGRHVITPSV